MPSSAIRHGGDGSVDRFLELVEGATVGDEANSNTVIVESGGETGAFVIRSCNADDGRGTVNQVRPIRFAWCVVHAAAHARWYIIAPHELVRLASTKHRGHHSQIAFEEINLSLGKDGLSIPCAEVGDAEVSDAIHAAIAAGPGNLAFRDAMNNLREELVELRDKYRTVVDGI